jgi:hypothetical protein
MLEDGTNIILSEKDKKWESFKKWDAIAFTYNVKKD